jgi:hypothetical protein
MQATNIPELCYIIFYRLWSFGQRIGILRGRRPVEVQSEVVNWFVKELVYVLYGFCVAFYSGFIVSDALHRDKRLRVSCSTSFL